MTGQTKFLDGQGLLSLVEGRVKCLQPDFDRVYVVVVRFGRSENQPLSVLKVSELSIGEKILALGRIGCRIAYKVFAPDVRRSEVEKALKDSMRDERVLGVLVQRPVPTVHADLLKRLVSPHKDLDAYTGYGSRFTIPAAAESCLRVLDGFLVNSRPVGVAGSKGYIGSAVCHALKGRLIPTIEIDRGDDLREIRKTDCVVSSIGQPRILGRQALPRYRKLVIDVGFCISERTSRIYGDVDPDAFANVQYLTPVPGGIGPLSIATILERVTSLQKGTRLRLWDFQDLRWSEHRS